MKKPQTDTSAAVANAEGDLTRATGMRDDRAGELSAAEAAYAAEPTDARWQAVCDARALRERAALEVAGAEARRAAAVDAHAAAERAAKAQDLVALERGLDRGTAVEEIRACERARLVAIARHREELAAFDRQSAVIVERFNAHRERAAEIAEEISAATTVPPALHEKLPLAIRVLEDATGRADCDQDVVLDRFAALLGQNPHLDEAEFPRAEQLAALLAGTFGPRLREIAEARKVRHAEMREADRQREATERVEALFERTRDGERAGQLARELQVEWNLGSRVLA